MPAACPGGAAQVGTGTENRGSRDPVQRRACLRQVLRPVCNSGTGWRKKGELETWGK